MQEAIAAACVPARVRAGVGIRLVAVVALFRSRPDAVTALEEFAVGIAGRARHSAPAAICQRRGSNRPLDLHHLGLIDAPTHADERHVVPVQFTLNIERLRNSDIPRTDGRERFQPALHDIRRRIRRDGGSLYPVEVDDPVDGNGAVVGDALYFVRARGRRIIAFFAKARLHKEISAPRIKAAVPARVVVDLVAVVALLGAASESVAAETDVHKNGKIVIRIHIVRNGISRKCHICKPVSVQILAGNAP